MRRRPAHLDSRSRPTRRLLVASAVALAAAAAGGAAWASWTAYGHGDGTAPTEALAQLSLSPGAPTAQLSPGGSADVVLTISNPNASTVHIGSLALDEDQGADGFAVDAGHAACDLSTLSFTTATNGLFGWAVPGATDASAGTVTTTLPGALAMGLDAADECQSAVVTVYLSAGP